MVPSVWSPVTGAVRPPTSLKASPALSYDLSNDLSYSLTAPGKRTVVCFDFLPGRDALHGQYTRYVQMVQQNTIQQVTCAKSADIHFSECYKLDISYISNKHVI